MPPHRVYVEPFGGGASVLLRKPRSYAEVYNDLDGDVVNVFRVLRDQPDELRRALELTPFARVEFVRAHRRDAPDPVERARRTVVRSFMGFSSASLHVGTTRGGRSGTGFRAASNRSGTTPAHDWRNFPAHVYEFAERLRGVVIEHRDALRVIAHHDGPDTLFYCDPPYVLETRDDARPDYTHELDEPAHRALAAALRQAAGMALVSGYRCALYDTLYAGWLRVDREALADGARPRIESVWMNAAAHRRGLAGQLEFWEAGGAG